MRTAAIVLGGLLAGGAVYAQQVISAQSGTVHYIEGTVYAADQLVQRKFGEFPALRNGEEIRTDDGRAEVLLTPGAFLRLPEHSSVRMLSNRLTDTRIEVLTGSAMVECDELLKDNAITLVHQGNDIQLQKHGLYRIDSEPPTLRVYDGEAVIHSATGQVTLKAGKETALNGVLVAQNFDRKLLKDDFYQWSSQRSSNLAYATVTASQSMLNNGGAWRNSGWYWSDLLDEYTFLPGRGIIYSPFGWQYWSPYMMSYYYTPVYYTGGGAGAGRYGTAASGARPSPGTSSGVASNPHPGMARSAPSFNGGSSGGFNGGSAGGFSGGGGGFSGGGGGFSHAGGGFAGGGASAGGGHAGGGGSHR